VDDAVCSHECTLPQVLVANSMLNESVEPQPGRNAFFTDIGLMPFDQLSRKHFPVPGKLKACIMRLKSKLKRVAGRLHRTLRDLIHKGTSG
jgi:hypothetical protein